MDFSDKMQRCHDYIEALEEERRKIQVFQRELPLCLELVSQGIPHLSLFLPYFFFSVLDFEVLSGCVSWVCSD